MPRRKGLIRNLLERRRQRMQMQVPRKVRKVPPEAEEAAQQLLALKRREASTTIAKKEVEIEL